MDNQEIASFRRAIEQVVKDIFIGIPYFLVCKAQINFQILIHPQYSVGGNLHYDVCLLKLDKPISFPDHPNVSDLVFLPKSQKFLSDPGLIIGLSLCHYATLYFLNK